MVWLAAQLVDPNRVKPFCSYALLGDDIVIADKAVAESYKKLLDKLGVSCWFSGSSSSTHSPFKTVGTFVGGS